MSVSVETRKLMNDVQAKVAARHQAPPVPTVAPPAEVPPQPAPVASAATPEAAPVVEVPAAVVPEAVPAPEVAPAETAAEKKRSLKLRLRNGEEREFDEEDVLRLAVVGEDREFRRSQLAEEKAGVAAEAARVKAAEEKLAEAGRDIERIGIDGATHYLRSLFEQNPTATVAQLLAALPARQSGGTPGKTLTHADPTVQALLTRLDRLEGERDSERTRAGELARVKTVLDAADAHATAYGLVGYGRLRDSVGQRHLDRMILTMVQPGADGRSEFTVEEAVDALTRGVSGGPMAGAPPAPGAQKGPESKPKPTAPPRITGGGAAPPGVERKGSGKDGRMLPIDLLPAGARAMREARVFTR